jgi:putative two-component system response regulator
MPVGTVLIVDDNEGNVRLLERMLKVDGCAVLKARDGATAVRLVQKERVDLVLMDVMIPTIDGFQACRLIKQNPLTRLVPVVLVTTLKETADRVRGIEVGADDFLTRPFNPHELRARVRSLLRFKRYTDDLDLAESVILSLAQTIEARDPATDGHCERLAHYSVALGRALGLDAEELAALERGGYLHDLGKIGVPDSILLKAGPLTKPEYEQMKQHTVIGDRLCGQLRSLQRVRPIVRHHHERLDGTGYPDGLRNSQFPMLAQIMSVVDVYDALMTVRPYKPAFTHDMAASELFHEVERGWRDRQLVEAFLTLIDSTELVVLA